jgi:hypothetical protein
VTDSSHLKKTAGSISFFITVAVPAPGFIEHRYLSRQPDKNNQKNGEGQTWLPFFSCALK